LNYNTEIWGDCMACERYIGIAKHLYGNLCSFARHEGSNWYW